MVLQLGTEHWGYNMFISEALLNISQLIVNGQ